MRIANASWLSWIGSRILMLAREFSKLRMGGTFTANARAYYANQTFVSVVQNHLSGIQFLIASPSNNLKYCYI